MNRRKLIIILALLILFFFCYVQVTRLLLPSPAAQNKQLNTQLKQVPETSGLRHQKAEKKGKPSHSAGNNSPMLIKGAHDLVISNKNIKGGTDACITLIDCYNIKIINCKLTNSSEPGIYIYNSNNVVVQENFFSNVSTGVYVENSFKGGIKVSHNRFINMLGPFPRGQCIQFNNVNGSGNLISYNICQNISGQSYPEDAISLYKSNGTPDSPIVVANNQIKGGGPSKSGGGIMLGDSGGSNQTAINNILVDPGQYGIAISGGDNNSIIGNYIYARAQHFTNVGIYVAGYNGQTCTNITVKSNKVNFMNNLGKANNSWIGPNTSMPSGWDANFWGAELTPDILSY